MSRLEELYLEEMDITTTTINGLAPGKSGVPCPLLRSLNVVIRKRMSIEKAASTIKPILQLRDEAGFPLEEATIRVSDSDNWLDLLSYPMYAL
jgi:hypothetical protein